MRLDHVYADIGAALKAAGYDAYQWAAPKAYQLPGALAEFPKEIRFRQRFAGGEEIDVDVVVAVSSVDAEDAWQRLAAAASTEQIPDALPPVKTVLEAENAGRWRELVVTSLDSFGRYNTGAAEAYGFLAHCIVRCAKPGKFPDTPDPDEETS